MKAKHVIPLSLFLLTAGLYLRSVTFDFVNYDDNHYFYDNSHVTGGLSWQNVKWAFEIHGPSMWIPATWLSHQASVSLFGAAPGPHHLVNLLLHAANAALVSIFLARMIGSWKPAAFAAACFAFHPIHVESVAWITERKDVLALFFSLSSLLAYLRYQQRRKPLDFVFVLSLHALAVMAKPLAVTLPCVMLLIDFLARPSPTPKTTPSRLLAEKIPLFAVSFFASYMTILCQRSINAIGSLDSFPLNVRLANAALAYASYLKQFFFPSRLVPFYPYQHESSLAALLLSLALLLAFTLGCLWAFRRQRPTYLLGWLWYLGTLVPMIGIVQAGSQAMANRYAYLPFIGLYLILAYLFQQLIQRFPCHSRTVLVASLLPILLLASATYRQIGYWKNSQSLFTHTLAVNPQNYLAHNNLGIVLKNQGQPEAARQRFKAALAIHPTYTESINNLGLLEAEAGDFPAAQAYFENVLQLVPHHPTATHNLAKIAFERGQTAEAEAGFRAAIEEDPDFSEAHYELGYLLLATPRPAEAATSFKRALELAPRRPNAWINYAISLSSLGQFAAAKAVYRETLERFPDNALATRNYALLLLQMEEPSQADRVLEKFLHRNPENHELRNFWATSLRERGHLEKAIGQFEILAEREPGNAQTHHNLGVLYGRLGDHAAALFEFEKALAINPRHPAFLRNKASAEAMLIKNGEL